jgi:hypothetical protein
MQHQKMKQYSLLKSQTIRGPQTRCWETLMYMTEKPPELLSGMQKTDFLNFIMCLYTAAKYETIWIFEASFNVIATYLNLS